MASQETDAALASILGPLKTQRDRVSGELRQAQALVAGLKSELRQIERVLEAADPTPKPPKPTGPGTHQVSDEAVDKVLAFAREHYGDGSEFHATGLHREAAGSLGMSSQTVTSALHELRERDLVRLVRRGTGGSRVYKLR